MMNPSRSNFGPIKRTWDKNKSRNGKRFISERMNGIQKDVERSQALRRWPMGCTNSIDNRRKDATNKPVAHRTKIPTFSKVVGAEISITSKRTETFVVGQCSKGVAKNFEKFSHMKASVNKSNFASTLGTGKVNQNFTSIGRNKGIDVHLAEHCNGKRMQGLSHKLANNSLCNGEDPSREECDEVLCLTDGSNRMLSSKLIVDNEGRIRKALPCANNNVSDRSRKRVVPMQQKCMTNDDINKASENLTSKKPSPQNKHGRYIEANEDESDDVNQNVVCSKDGIFGVRVPTALEAIKRQSLLLNEKPIWSGILKIDNEKYVSIAGHLLTKSSKSVCMLSRSLLPVVKVTKHSRLEVWPMSSEVSGPTDENIHMILFPHSIRSDKDVDQLIKELMDNDLALRAVVGEAEMLIFPSIILPKQYQTFKGKHYLWGVFRPKKDPEGANTQDKVNQESTSAQGSSNASAAAAAATIPANLQWISSSSGIPTGMMFAFVPQPSPRIEQLIQEMQREGVVFVGMPEMAAGPGLVQAAAAAAAASAME